MGQSGSIFVLKSKGSDHPESDGRRHSPACLCTSCVWRREWERQGITVLARGQAWHPKQSRQGG